MTADRRGGDTPSPNQQTGEAHRSTWEDRRTHLSWKLRRRMNRRTLLAALAVTVGGPLILAGGGLAKFAYDNNKDKIWGSKPAEAVDRKNVDVTDKTEVPRFIVDDATKLVRILVKERFLGKFMTKTRDEDKALEDNLAAESKRMILTPDDYMMKIKDPERLALAADFLKRPGYAVILSDFLPLQSQIQGAYFWGDYKDNKDLTPTGQTLYGALPFQDIPEVKDSVFKGKSPEGLVDEIPVAKIPDAFKTVINMSFLNPDKIRTFFSGGVWQAEGFRISDGARVVMGATRNGRFAVRVEDEPFHLRPGDSEWMYLDDHVFGLDRKNMSVEGLGAIPQVAAEDAVTVIKTLLKAPYRGLVATESVSSEPYVKVRLYEKLRRGNRLYGAEGGGLVDDPLPEDWNDSQRQRARKNREEPWYSFDNLDQKLPKFANTLVKPDMYIKYKSNTELQAPVQVIFLGQLPLGEMDSVKGAAKPAKLEDGRSYQRVDVKDIPKAFKEAFDLSYLTSGSFKPVFDFNNQRWRATGERESDKAKVEIVAAPDGRFAIRIEDKDYKPGPNENHKLEVPSRPPARSS